MKVFLYRCSFLPKALPKGPLAAGCCQSPAAANDNQWLSLPGWFILFTVWRAILTKHSPWRRTLEHSSSVDTNTMPSQFSICFIALISSGFQVLILSPCRALWSHHHQKAVVTIYSYKANTATVTVSVTHSSTMHWSIISLILTAVGLLQSELFLHSSWKHKLIRQKYIKLFQIRFRHELSHTHEPSVTGSPEWGVLQCDNTGKQLYCAETATENTSRLWRCRT